MCEEAYHDEKIVIRYFVADDSSSIYAGCIYSSNGRRRLFGRSGAAGTGAC